MERLLKSTAKLAPVSVHADGCDTRHYYKIGEKGGARTLRFELRGARGHWFWVCLPHREERLSVRFDTVGNAVQWLVGNATELFATYLMEEEGRFRFMQRMQDAYIRPTKKRRAKGG